MKKVSIIIPIYNGEKYIEQCLKSIERQTYNNLEIICINDGSTDNSENILKEKAILDKRIVVCSKKNEGVSIARNTGINLATGDYITFIDIDDWIEKDWIEKLVNKMNTTNCEVVRGNFVKENKSKKVVQYGNLKNMKNILIKEDKKQMKKLQEYIVTGYLPAYTCLLLIKKEVFLSNLRFQDNIIFMEDTIFYIDLLNSIKSIFLYDIKGYHYYYNCNSATKSPDLYKKNIENIMRVNTILHTKLDKDLYSRMDLRHLKSIKEYIFKLYKLKKKKIKEIKHIFENKKIQGMFEEINENDLKEERLIKMIKNKKYFMISIWFTIRKFISKIRDRFLGER